MNILFLLSEKGIFIPSDFMPREKQKPSEPRELTKRLLFSSFFLLLFIDAKFSVVFAHKPYEISFYPEI